MTAFEDVERDLGDLEGKVDRLEDAVTAIQGSALSEAGVTVVCWHCDGNPDFYVGCALCKNNGTIWLRTPTKQGPLEDEDDEE